MDKITAPELGRRLGVSLPRVHRELDRLGVARRGRGVVRDVPQDAGERIADRLGAVPVIPAGFDRVEMLVLAVLVRSPLGVRSLRQAATRSGVSPTAVSRALGRLEAAGLVERRVRMEAAGAAQQVARWQPVDHLHWSPALLSAVRVVRLPRQRFATTVGPVPRRFAHLFWNTDSRRLQLPDDAAYVAGRLLGLDDIEATMWALRHLPRAAIETAVSRRGTDARTRALAGLLADQHAADDGEVVGHG